MIFEYVVHIAGTGRRLRVTAQAVGALVTLHGRIAQDRLFAAFALRPGLDFKLQGDVGRTVLVLDDIPDTFRHSRAAGFSAKSIVIHWVEMSS